MPKAKKGAEQALDADWQRTSREMRDKFMARIEKLWTTHFFEAKSILDEAEKKIMNLTFKATLDFTESEAKLESSIRFSQVHTDSTEDTFDNPIPGPDLPGEPLGDLDAQARKETKSVRAKRREAAKAAREGADGEPAQINQSE